MFKSSVYNVAFIVRCALLELIECRGLKLTFTRQANPAYWNRKLLRSQQLISMTTNAIGFGQTDGVFGVHKQRSNGEEVYLSRPFG